jgi:hypothetical protein
VTWICEAGYPKGIGFYKWLAQHGWDESQAIKQARGDEGYKVHAAIKALLNGETVTMESAFYNETLNAPEPLNPDEYECLMSFCDWFALARPAVISCEYVVWNESSVPGNGYAGMVDLKCCLSADYLATALKGRHKWGIEGAKHQPEDVWIVDFKTSQYLWPSHEIQVSAYKHADRGVDRLGILQLGYRSNKAGFKFSEIADQYDLFLAARQIWAKETAGQAPLQRDYPLSLTLPGVKAEKAEA